MSLFSTDRNAVSPASGIPTTCAFILDWEEEESSSRRKKPFCLRWPDEMRDAVLARLLALNAKRAQMESLAGKALADVKPPSRCGRKPVAASLSSLFVDDF
ncbi:MAG: hypothetical protein H7835_07110 [Magnetococcus sp. XQGC-1]